jgi:membrane protein implicated in regulation of membrane protease activity
MQSIVDFFWSLGAWNWFIVAVVMLVLEMLVPGAHIVWFGMAAVVVGLLAVSIDIPLHWQLIIFALVALGAIYSVRRYWRPEAVESDQPNLNVRAAQYIGRIVTVEEAIADGRGKVRVGDTVWNAEGPDLPKGAHVKVTGANGTVLVVTASAGGR